MNQGIAETFHPTDIIGGVLRFSLPGTASRLCVAGRFELMVAAISGLASGVATVYCMYSIRKSNGSTEREVPSTERSFCS